MGTETRSFNCTNCGGPLDLKGNEGPTIRCPYCNASVAVPAEFRTAAAQPRSGVPVLGILLAVGAVGVAAVALIFLVLFRSPASDSNARTNNSTGPAQPLAQVIPSRTPPRPTAVPTPGFASQVLAFGSQGITPGLLNRATNIAVDGSGNIYVGDREGGRVQVFDPTGKFVTLWTVGNSKSILYGIAADHAGNLYTSTDGNIERHEGASGKLISTLQYSGGSNFQSIALAPDGSLDAMWYQEHPGVLDSREGVEGDLVQFDPLGKVTRVITSVVSSITDGPERDLHLAVDGTGSIYAASSYSSSIFKFTREGKYVLRFGSRGDSSKPNQFSLGTLSVAIDSAGRAFASNNDRVLVFDPSGQYLDSFGIGGSAYGIAIGEKNQIAVVKGTQAAVFAVNEH